MTAFDPPQTAPYSLSTNVMYSCTDGFALTGGDRTRQCGSSSSGPGMWTGTAPVCQGLSLPIVNLAFAHVLYVVFNE